MALDSIRTAFPKPDVEGVAAFRFTLDGGGREIVSKLIRNSGARQLLEIGVFLGGSTWDWLEASPDLTVIGVDPWDEATLRRTPRDYSKSPHMNSCFRYIEDRDAFIDSFEEHGFYLSAVANLSGFGDRFVPVKATSPDILHRLSGWGFAPDIIYIDAFKHRDDLDAAHGCFPNARLCGDDWTWNAKEDYPMRRAVEAFASDHGLRIEVDRATWVLHPKDGA